MNSNATADLDREIDELLNDLDDHEIDYDRKLRQLSAAERSKLCKHHVDRNLHLGEENEDLARRLRNQYSLKRWLLRHVVDAAMNYAISIDATVWDFANEISHEGICVVCELESGLVKYDWDNPKRDGSEWNFWSHEKDPLSLVRGGNKPYMCRDIIECTASEYLKLPYRVQELERILIDVLVALELYAFADEMLTPLPRGVRFLTTSPINQKHVLRRYIGGQFWGAVILLGIAFGAVMFLPPLIGETATLWIAGIAVALFLLSFVISTIALPFGWRDQSQARARVWKLIEETVMTYAELSSNNVLSARRIRDAATKAADAGVLWPGPLFAILDDNISRTGRL